MDMKINGRGTVIAGEYDKIVITGSGEIDGFVRCKRFFGSGSTRGEGGIECLEELHASGNCSFKGVVKAAEMSVSGSFTGEKNIIGGDVRCSGSLRCLASLKGKYIGISGKADIAGDVEGESVKVTGKLSCGGLLNAEEVNIGITQGMELGSIGGSRIHIYRDGGLKAPKGARLPLFTSLVSPVGIVRIHGSVEGDEIALESVYAPRVSGRIVAIGAGCKIDLVQYTEKAEISPEAVVDRVEKMEKGPEDEYTPPPIVPPVPVESVMPTPENLYDSAGNVRGMVYTEKVGYVEIDGFGYYPAHEMYYDTQGHVRGINYPEGITGGGWDKKCVYWKISQKNRELFGAHFALIKFYDPETEEPERVLNGKYDRVIELPTSEGILFFEEYIADAVVAGQKEAQRIMEEGLLAVRKYAAGFIQDAGDPFLKAIEEQREEEKMQ